MYTGGNKMRLQFRENYQNLSDAEKNVENREDQRGFYLYTDHIQLHNSMIMIMLYGFTTVVGTQ